MNKSSTFRWAGWLTLVLFVPVITAENIDPYQDNSQYVWAENAGWLNFEPSHGPGVQADNAGLAGYVWAENIGWINLSCRNGDQCGSVEFGVANDGSGRLTGFAWGENVGWINFNPQVPGDSTWYGVTIDDNGIFNGLAWGENIGWLRFSSVGAMPFKVQACKVSMDDLANFAELWLTAGIGPGDIDGSGKTDIKDFAILAQYWNNFCPNGWMLK